jgi:hypothetical protein
MDRHFNMLASLDASYRLTVYHDAVGARPVT